MVNVKVVKSKVYVIQRPNCIAQLFGARSWR